MSLDVYLTIPREPTQRQRAVACLRSNGFDSDAECLEAQHDPDYTGPVYEANITHNLGGMAREAGIYQACWRPEELGVTKARQLVPLLRVGLEKLRADPKHYEQFNAANGWGVYEQFVPWVQSYLAACEEYPEADVTVSR